MSDLKDEVYISVDVEASGPIPGQYSLLSIGACVVRKPSVQFYVELQPISDNAVPDALAVSGLSLAELERRGRSPKRAMQDFSDWIETACGPGTPVFVGFNACFDWSFVNWYFHHFLGRNPFGIGGIDIKGYYMGRVNCRWTETTSSQLPPNLQPQKPLTHNALADAIAQGDIFRRLLDSGVAPNNPRRQKP